MSKNKWISLLLYDFRGEYKVRVLPGFCKYCESRCLGDPRGVRSTISDRLNYGTGNCKLNGQLN